MFLRTVINLTTCIYILSCKCQNSNYHDLSLYYKDDRIIKDKVDILEKLLVTLNPSSLKPHEGDAKSEIVARFKEVNEKRNRAKIEIMKIYRQKGVFIGEKKRYGEMLCILGVRSRLEIRANDLYPNGRPFNVSVVEAYKEILTSNESKFKDRSPIIVFRQRISKYGISITDFVDAVRTIYGIFSDEAAHKIMSVFELSPPKYNDLKGIKKMYMRFGVTSNEAMVMTAQIILEPLPILHSSK